MSVSQGKWLSQWTANTGVPVEQSEEGDAQSLEDTNIVSSSMIGGWEESTSISSFPCLAF
jgi:hypothetical protein